MLFSQGSCIRTCFDLRASYSSTAAARHLHLTYDLGANRAAYRLATSTKPSCKFKFLIVCLNYVCVGSGNTLRFKISINFSFHSRSLSDNLLYRWKINSIALLTYCPHFLQCDINLVNKKALKLKRLFSCNINQLVHDGFKKISI